MIKISEFEAAFLLSLKNVKAEKEHDGAIRKLIITLDDHTEIHVVASEQGDPELAFYQVNT